MLLSTLPESIEFKLLLELTHPTPSLALSDIIAKVQMPQFNHEKLLKMVKWHRVTPQVYQQLAPIQDDLPVDFFQSLQRINTRCRMESLKLSTWLAKITLLFREENIDFISLKGIGLSRQLYAESSYRQCRDIDLLIEARDIDVAEEVLTGVGFERTYPPIDVTPKQLAFLNRHKKDREYLNPKDGTIVEVHWRLTEVDHPFNPSLNNLLATGDSFAVHGNELNTVSGNDLWLYQSLHGSYSGWYRLRWICDIAQLLCHHKPDWNSLLDRAEQYGCRNSLLEAIGMACTLYKLPVPEQIDQLLRKNRPVWNNIKICNDFLVHMKLMRGVPDIARIHFWAPEKSFIKFLFTHGSITPTDFGRFRFPDTLFFLYYVVRPFSFVYRQLNTKKVS